MSDTFISNRGGFGYRNSPEETEERSGQTEETSGPAEETAPAESPAEPVETTPYAYGPPATTPRESNFISDENLLVWLAEKQDGLYGELRDHMDTSKDRSKLMQDLSHLKERVDRGEMNGAELQAELETLIASYEGTPLGAELEETFRPMIDTIDASLLKDIQITKLETHFAKGFSDEIQSKIDAISRDDQLALIQIQSLTADIREAAQLASNLLASTNQATNAIVGNIGR